MEEELPNRLESLNINDRLPQQSSSPFSLGTVDIYLLKAILQKTDALSFVKLVRTCKLMRDVMESVSSWQIVLPDATMYYLVDKKFWLYYKEHNKQRVPSKMSHSRTEYISFPDIQLTNCKAEFLHEIVFPEIAKMKGIQHVQLNYTMDPNDLATLISLLEGRQLTLEYPNCNYNENNATLKRMKTVKINVHREEAALYYHGGTSKIFSAMENRTELTFFFPELTEQLVCDIIKKWLKGAQVQTLDTLALVFENPQKFEEVKSQVMKKLAIDNSFQDFIYGLYDPAEAEGSIGTTISNQLLLSRNPRYGPNQRLLLRFAAETVVFQFQR